MRDLLLTMPQIGRLEWIGVRPDRREPMVEVAEAYVDETGGLNGDRYAGKLDGKRMVTLMQAEHLPAIASILGQAEVSPANLRRNLVVSGINLLAMKGFKDDIRFSVGEAEFRMTGNCHPCSRMEENLGPGGYNAMRGHGGITAAVTGAGRIRIGDPVEMVVVKQ